jgi:hypothetical protein
MPTLYAPAWRDHTSDFINFGVRLASEALRLLQRWGLFRLVRKDLKSCSCEGGLYPIISIQCYFSRTTI